MDFSSIGRRLSQDHSWDGEAADARAAALKASLSEGSSRLMSSVRATKKDIFGGLSSRLDQVQNALKGVAGEPSGGGREGELPPASPGAAPRRESRPKPQKPPPPKLTRRTTVNGGIYDGVTDASSTESARVRVRPNMTISFDEPLYSQTTSLPVDNNNAGAPERKPFRNPFLDDYMSDVSSSASPNVVADVHATNVTNLVPDVACAPCPPPQAAGFLATARPADLLAITPTSGEALPLPGIKPTVPVKRDSQEIYDDSDGDSEATEGCDDTPDRDPYGTDVECAGPLFRSGSVGSDKSWTSTFSNDSHPDEVTEQSMAFMKEFVARIFGNGSVTMIYISQLSIYALNRPMPVVVLS